VIGELLQEADTNHKHGYSWRNTPTFVSNVLPFLKSLW